MFEPIDYGICPCCDGKTVLDFIVVDHEIKDVVDCTGCKQRLFQEK